MRLRVLLVAGGLWLVSCPLSGAEEPARQEVPGNPLERSLAEYDRLDQELAAVTQQLATARGAERRRLEPRQRALQQAQERLLDQLEQLVGPLPPTARPQSSTPAQQQQTSQEQRAEAILDSARDRRLHQ